MTVRFATPSEIAKWDSLIINNPDGGVVFQSYTFGQQKEAFGWNVLHLICDNYAITVLEKKYFGLGGLWYLPKGPGVVNDTELLTVTAALKEFARQKGAFLLKIESEISMSPDTVKKLHENGFVKTPNIQPNHSTVILDISPDLEKVMEGLPQKGRHAIRRAERDGVTVRFEPTTDESCKKMFDLMTETAAGRFNVRNLPYYTAFWTAFSKAGIGQLAFAYYEEKLVAGAFLMVYGKKATYKDGASIRAKTAYGASHYLQWEAIKWAKERGATSYDLCGTPPPDRIDDPTHNFYGLGRFKTSFNKTVTQYIGTYDVPVKPRRYWLWTHVVDHFIGAFYARILKRYFY